MKIIVDSLPAYCGDCIFCSDIYYNECGISKSRCELSMLENCPYLRTVDNYLSEVNDEK